MTCEATRPRNLLQTRCNNIIYELRHHNFFSLKLKKSYLPLFLFYSHFKLPQVEKSLKEFFFPEFRVEVIGNFFIKSVIWSGFIFTSVEKAFGRCEKLKSERKIEENPHILVFNHKRSSKGDDKLFSPPFFYLGSNRASQIW